MKEKLRAYLASFRVSGLCLVCSGFAFGLLLVVLFGLQRACCRSRVQARCARRVGFACGLLLACFRLACLWRVSGRFNVQAGGYARVAGFRPALGLLLVCY